MSACRELCARRWPACLWPLSALTCVLVSMQVCPSPTWVSVCKRPRTLVSPKRAQAVAVLLGLCSHTCVLVLSTASVALLVCAHVHVGVPENACMRLGGVCGCGVGGMRLNRGRLSGAQRKSKRSLGGQGRGGGPADEAVAGAMNPPVPLPPPAGPTAPGLAPAQGGGCRAPHSSLGTQRHRLGR